MCESLALQLVYALLQGSAAANKGLSKLGMLVGQMQLKDRRGGSRIKEERGSV